MFQIKDFASITLSQINHARAVTSKITDFQPGSVARTLLEAPAVEIEELYLQMLLGLRDAIPVATFLSFGFNKLPSARAVGYVSVTAVSPLESNRPIPAGTTFSTPDGRVYATLADTVWLAGSTSIILQVAHERAGVAGNVAAGVITSSGAFGVGFTISNQAISNGRDEETDAEREARFADFVRSLSRGTVTACLYAARSTRLLAPDGTITEYVMRAGLDEQAGYVRIYIYSNLGIPSLELLAEGQRVIDGWRDEETGTVMPGYRAAGVRVDMLPMVERSVPLAFQVGMFSGYELTPAVIQRLRDIASDSVRNVQPGTTLWLGTLVEQLLAAPGVRSVVPASNENINCAVNEALIPGTIAITELAY